MINGSMKKPKKKVLKKINTIYQNCIKSKSKREICSNICIHKKKENKQPHFTNKTTSNKQINK